MIFLSNLAFLPFQGWSDVAVCLSRAHGRFNERLYTYVAIPLITLFTFSRYPMIHASLDRRASVK